MTTHCKCGGVLLHLETVRFGYLAECQLCGKEHLDSDYPSEEVCFVCGALYAHEDGYPVPIHCPECRLFNEEVA
jgi:hypothetical protein